MKRIIAILLMITAAAAVHAQETVLPKFDLCITSSIGIGGSINVAGIRSYSIHHEQEVYKEGDNVVWRQDAYTEKITTIPAELTFMASFKFNRIFFGAEYSPGFIYGLTYAVGKLGWNYIHNKDNVKGHYNMSTYMMGGYGDDGLLLGVGTSGEITRHLSLNGSILLGNGINGSPINITLSVGITVDLHFLAF